MTLKKALLNRLSRKFKLNSDPVGYDKARTIGIIIHYDWFAELETIGPELTKDGKDHRVVCYVPNPKKETRYPINSFSDKDVTISGQLMGDELHYFVKQPFDILLCYDPTGNDIIKYILTKSNARHRIGIFHSNFAEQLDMMIQPSDENHLTMDLMKYVKMIRHD